MHGMKRNPIEEAFRQVADHFPFPEYLRNSAAAGRVIAQTILDLSPPPKSLLDIGCGAMDRTGILAALGYQCSACDDFEDPWHRRNGNLEKLTNFASSMQIDLHIQSDSSDLPWEKGTFDIVTAFDLIEHLHESPRNLLNTAGGLVRDGGLIAVTTPNSVNLRKRLYVMRGRSNYPEIWGFYEAIGLWRGHVREYTPDELVSVVEWNGFEVIRRKMFHGLLGYRVTSPYLVWPYKTLCALLPNWRDTILVVARKPLDWRPRQADPERFRRSVAPFVPREVA